MDRIEKSSEVVKIVMKLIKPRECKHCQSKNTVRYGKFRGVQRWWCKDCKRKFADTEALPGMKTPANQVAAAVSKYMKECHSTPFADSYNKSIITTKPVILIRD